MRWDTGTEGALPPATCQELQDTYRSVERYLVERSKALAGGQQGGVPPAWQAGAQPAHGAGWPGPCAPPGGPLDPALLSALDAFAARCLAPEWRTGQQLMEQLALGLRVLPTGHAGLDQLLGGGLREGAVVELAGETTSGKTQLCLLATAVTAGRGEQVVYVDTTGAFNPARVMQLAAGQTGPGQALDGFLLDPERLLGCVSLHRCSSVFALLALLDRLAVALQAGQRAWAQHAQQRAQHGGGVQQAQHGQGQGAVHGPAPGGPMDVDGGSGAGGCGAGPAGVQVLAPPDPGDPAQTPHLLVIDSVSALLSTVVGSTQHTQGNALLTTVGRQLKQLADVHGMAVLLTNHVTSAGGGPRGGDREGGGPGVGVGVGVGGLKPALGEQWRPQPGMRVQLSVDEAAPPDSGRRVATLTASPLAPTGSASSIAFTLTAAGVG